MRTTNIITGIIGIGGVETVNQINIEQIQHGGGLLLQAIIAVLTIIKLFKKNGNNKELQ